MLTPQQHATLRAALDRIIPPDDNSPGASAAGVDDYLLGQFGRDLQSALPMYQSCLDALDVEARTAQGKPFADLSPAEQDALLGRIEKGTVHDKKAWTNEPDLFFAKLVQHAWEGFFADPGNGGNKNGVAWKLIGFEVRG